MIGIVESDRKGIKEYVVASSNEMWCFRWFCSAFSRFHS